MKKLLSLLLCAALLLACVSAASGVIPQIAVVTGVCTGMAATVASMFDVLVILSAITLCICIRLRDCLS